MTLLRSFSRGVFAAPLLAALTISPAVAQPRPLADRVVGNWEGALAVSALSLRLAFTVQKDPAGALAGILTSIDQGGTQFPFTVSLPGDSLVRFEVAAIGGAFAGKPSADGDSLDGAWSQGGGTLPLKLRRVVQITTPRRPQEPRGPFPYSAQEVTFTSADSGVTLAGTLTLPPGTGPHPAVILVTGSGAQDRDESLLGHKPFAVLADHLTRQGIAVLRFDDRGEGRSTGRFVGATSADFARDVLGGVRYLRSRREVAPGKIGVLGHSEGGMIAPLVAVESADVAFLVLLAGTGVPGDSILVAQGSLIARASGAPDAAVARQRDVQSRMFAAVRAGGDTMAMREKLREITRELLASLTDEEQRAAGATPQAMEQQVQMVSSPWFRWFLTYDPRPVLRRVRVPVLAINGGLDLQVPPKENLAAIEAALRAGGNRDVRTIEFPGLNHLFQTATTGAPTEYGLIEETMSPAVLNAVAAWILERFGPGR